VLILFPTDGGLPFGVEPKSVPGKQVWRSGRTFGRSHLSGTFVPGPENKPLLLLCLLTQASTIFIQEPSILCRVVKEASPECPSMIERGQFASYKRFT
jgi:hypothetical protein